MHRAVATVRRLGAAFLVTVCGPASCGDVPPDDEIGVSTHPIRNGTLIPEENSGHVYVGNYVGNKCRGSCSGTLLNNEWVLTAAHCVRHTTPPTDQVWVLMGEQGQLVDRIVRHPGYVMPPPSACESSSSTGSDGTPADIALLHLAAPMAMNGTAAGYGMGLFTPPGANLVGRTVTCYGVGRFTDNLLVPPDFKLRRARITYTGIQTGLVTTTANALGQIGMSGDSGGGCFFDLHGTRALTSVMVASRRTFEAHHHLDIPTEGFRDWALATMYPAGGPPTCHGAGCPGAACRDVHCRTTALLGDNVDWSYTWNPCQSRSFDWQLRGQFETNWDYVYIGSVRWSGAVNRTGTASGPLSLRVTTDINIASPGISYLTAYCHRFDVGVVAPAGSPNCANGEDMVVFNMDDEDDDNRNARGGWFGASTSTGSTSLRFCRADGRIFGPLTETVSDPRFHYALLKLGDRCPANSTEFSRFFDNEDDGNDNSWTGGIFPNAIANNTQLRFCLFRLGTPSMYNGFPGMARMDGAWMAYGVLARDTFIARKETGFIRTDDEDSDNSNVLGCGSICADVTPIVSGGSNTTMRFARVH